LPSDNEAQITFNRIPISTLLREIEEANKKWQKEWEEGTKAAITKFFPEMQDKQNLKIVINPVFTAMVKGHGKTMAYLHRFRIVEHATCPCGKGEQTIDHLINQCLILHKQREIFKSNVLISGNWPPSKREIISKHLKSFLLFLKSINFQIL
jgi:hypothetical protein